jgi:hypothetical protein
MSNMAAFLAGFGKGYLGAKDKEAERKRQEQEDAWRNEQRDRQRGEWKEADQLKTDLKDAAATREVQQGTITESGGQNVFSQNPAQAASLRDMMAAEAELRGDTVTQQAGTAVTGTMARGHQITTAPVDAAKVNNPTARNQRIIDALMRNGQIERAATMENTLLDQTAKRLGLQREELKFADEQFNRKLTETFSGSGDWTQNAAKVMTDTQIDGLAGMTVTPKLSVDGKTVTFVGVSQDGKTSDLATFDNTPEGKARFLQHAVRAPAETKIGWLYEQSQSDKTAAKETKADERWQKDFDLRKQESESNMAYRQRMLQIQGAQEARAAAVHRVTMESAKIPPAVKMQAESLAKQIEGVNSALNKAMAEGSFDPNNPGTKQLLERQAVLGIQYSKAIEPYVPGAAKPAADPLDLNIN